MNHPEELHLQRVDAVFHWGGFALRAACYAALAATAGHYDFGPALLTGALLGDAAGQLASLAWKGRDQLATAAGTLLLLGGTWFVARANLGWPDDPAQRAILGLSAFGALVGAIGGSALTRFGPDEREFA